MSRSLKALVQIIEVGVGHKLEKIYTFSLIYAPPPPSGA
jgi:hypothetical protein